MKCRFDVGSKVEINNSAEVAFEHRGQMAIVVGSLPMGAGPITPTTPIKYDNKCTYKVKFSDGTILDNVDESELSSPS